MQSYSPLGDSPQHMRRSVEAMALTVSNHYDPQVNGQYRMDRTRRIGGNPATWGPPLPKKSMPGSDPRTWSPYPIQKNVNPPPALDNMTRSGAFQTKNLFNH